MLDFLEKQSKNNKDKYLIIMLHGWGSDKYDLISLDFNIDNLHYLSVNAPYECDSGFGYQWFSLEDMNVNSIIKEIRNNYIVLEKFIEEQSIKLHIDYNHIFLLGFSQGAMVSLATSIRLDKKIGGVISFSGFQPDTKETLKKDLRTKQNVLLVHGVNDPIVPYNLLIYSKDLLEQFSVDVEICPCLNLEHSINNFGLNTAVKYVKKLISVQ